MEKAPIPSFSQKEQTVTSALCDSMNAKNILKEKIKQLNSEKKHLDGQISELLQLYNSDGNRILKSEELQKYQQLDIFLNYEK